MKNSEKTGSDNTQANFPKLYTMAETGKILRRSTRKIWQLINDKKLGCVRQDRNVFVSEKQIETFLSEITIDP